ncbi:MAG: hypothetical protein EP297_16005, partial [Gammaproteobacteria bacterium]
MLIESVAGSAAYTAFRTSKLLQTIQQDLPDVEALQVQFLHLVHFNREPDSFERQVIQQLLHYGES